MTAITRRAALAAAATIPFAQQATAQPATPQATPRRGGTLNVAQCSANRRSASAQNARHPYFLVDATTRLPYACLVWVNRSLQLEAELAESWGPADATLAVWDVTLRPGLTFHDGTKVTARDVAASFEYHRTRSPFAQQITRIEAVNERTARFFLNAGNAEFPFVLGEYDSVIMPAAPPETIGLTGIGCGPYRIVATDPNRSITYERFDGYWRQGLPLLDQINLYNREGQQEAALNGLRAGQFDVVMTIDPRAVRQLEGNPEFAIESGGGGHHYVVQLPKHPGSPFLDKRVRQALAFAVDREAMVRLVYGPGQGWVGNDSHLVAADANFLARPQGRDVARARRLLAEAGYGPQRPLTLKVQISASGSGQMQPLPMNEFVQQNLKEIGVNVEFDVIEWNALFTNWRRGCKDASARGAHAINVSFAAMDPFFAMVRFWDSKMAPPTSNNWGHFSDPKFDAMVAEARTSFDPAARDAALARLHAAGVDEALFIWIAHDVAPRAMSPRVRGFVQPQSWFVDPTLPFIQ